ncbi:MAG TPA: YkvA family protein [bacterium]|nr:YkvA family protein [bacterium]
MATSALTLLTPVARRLPSYSRLAWALMRDRRLPLRHRALVVGGVVYLLSPIDLIPGIIPLLGQMDDLAVTLLSLRAVLRRIPPEIAAEHLASAGLTSQVIEDDLRTLNATGRLLSRTALRFGWRVAGRAVRGAAHLGRAVLQRRAR